MTRLTTDYEIFEKSSPKNRRMLREEKLIFEVTEALSEALAKEEITKAELAQRLNKTKGFVSQVLAGGRNLTLRTIADFADALGCEVRIQLVKEARPKEMVSRPSVSTLGFEAVDWLLSHKVLEVPARRIVGVSTRELVGKMRGAA